MQHISLAGEALKHLNDDLNKQNPVMQRSQAIVVAYSSPLFSANMLANLFKKTVASGAVLPVVVHTRGVKCHAQSLELAVHIQGVSYAHVVYMLTIASGYSMRARRDGKPSHQKMRPAYYPRSHVQRCQGERLVLCWPIEGAIPRSVVEGTAPC